jgi:hypothetical protein
MVSMDNCARCEAACFSGYLDTDGVLVPFCIDCGEDCGVLGTREWVSA